MGIRKMDLSRSVMLGRLMIASTSLKRWCWTRLQECKECCLLQRAWIRWKNHLQWVKGQGNLTIRFLITSFLYSFHSSHDESFEQCPIADPQNDPATLQKAREVEILSQRDEQVQRFRDKFSEHFEHIRYSTGLLDQESEKFFNQLAFKSECPSEEEQGLETLIPLELGKLVKQQLDKILQPCTLVL